MKTSKQKLGKQHQNTTVTRTPESSPTPEQIQARAHEIYLARGGAAGRELDDWLQAERELKAGKDPSTPI